MQDFFLGIMEITLGMSLLILLMLTGLRLIGGRFTSGCRYILWTLVMIRLAVPFSLGILPALIEVPVERELDPVQIQMQVPTLDYTPVVQNPVVIQPQEQIQIPTPPSETPVFTEPEPKPVTWDDVKEYIPHTYLAGAAVFLVWNLLSYMIYTGKILRSAKRADENTIEIYEAVCRKKELHHPPVLLVSPDVNSPAAFGIFRRRIVLPDIEFTENGLAGTLSHEVTHCKRGDLTIKAIALLARTLHWFNPLSHLAAFRCEMEMELSCDESVLAGCDENTRAAYGEVMLDIIRRCRRNRGALTTHFNPGKNAVKARFANILYGSGKRRGTWLIALCLVLCMIAGAVVACRTDAEPEDEAEQDEPMTAETEDSLPSLKISHDELLSTMESIETDESYPAEDYRIQVTGLSVPVTLTMHRDSVTAVEAFGNHAELSEPRDIYGNCTFELFESGGSVVLEGGYYGICDIYILSDRGIHIIHPGNMASFYLWQDENGSLKYMYSHNLMASIQQTGGLSVAVDYNEFLYSVGDASIANGEISFSEATEKYVISDKYDLDEEFSEIYSASYNSIDEVFEENRVKRADSLDQIIYGTDFKGWEDFESLTVLTESIDTLTGLESFRSRGIISDAVYEFYFNLLSGQSAIPEYNTLVIEDYTIRLTDDDRTTDFRFTVKESAMDTLPAGEYQWTVADLREVKVLNRSSDDDEFFTIPEVKKLFAFISGTYIYSTPTYGEGYEYPGMHNYICNYYSDISALEPEEYKRIAREEFGVTDFAPMDLETWTLDDGLIHAGGIGGSWFGEVEDVTEDETAVTVVMQFYADCNYLLKSHKIAYRFGKDGKWLGYEILVKSVYEPNGLHSTEDSEQSVTTVDPNTLYQTFLTDVLSPYQDYIVATEFLDLDGNGIDELIVYDVGASANCGVEIFTIENGEVRSFYTGTNAITHFDGNGAKALAPPSAYAADQPFWGMQTSNNNGKTNVPLWFQPCEGVRGHILYSHNGSSTHSTDDYFYFTCGSDGLLQVVPLGSFALQAVNDNYYEYGWHCYVNGVEVPADEYRSAEDQLWNEIAAQYGILFTAETTYDRDMLDRSPEYVMPEVVQPEEEIPAEEETPAVLVTEDSSGFTYEEWIQFVLNTDFGFRDPVDAAALTDAELEACMADAYTAALDIYSMHYISSDRMYGGRYWSSDMPGVTIGSLTYSQMFNPVFETLADWENYMHGILSDELTDQLMATGMFIDYEGELWGVMGARGTDISRKTVGCSVTSRTDTEIIYTAEVEVRETNPASEKPDYVEYYDFAYTLTEDGWRWTDFYLYV